jgi:hypothetical protein
MADNEMAANVRGGALVGGGFGGIIGAVLGWILASTLVPVPVIGPVVGQGVLSTALVAMIAGVAAGALLGALAGVFSRNGARDYVPVPTAPASVHAAPLAMSTAGDAELDMESAEFASTSTYVAPLVADAPLVPTFEVPDQPVADVPVDAEAAVEPQVTEGTPVLRVRRRRQISPPDSDNQPKE